ncbi:hypothetical protein BGZ81_008662 [Podila clonocystis]|nr:hypothetical protein BGZ81_008662 [Podila clonocystis]
MYRLYLAAFNVLILLFAVSYYQSIFSPPGSPSNPPSLRNPPPSIPATTTPYQSQSPGPTRSSSNDRVSSHAFVTTPVPSFQPSRLAHQGSSIAPIGPRYPSSIASPTAPTFPLSNDYPEHKDDHVIVIPPDNTSTHGHRLSIDSSVPPGGPMGSILGHGSARSRVHIVDDSLQKPVATLSVCKRDGRSRWCEICKIVKPDRCHHCSECNICVLRMDHHCPWVNGCVGFGNYKQFYLFILYGSLSAVWVVGTMIPLLVKTLASHTQDKDDWRKGNWTDSNYAYRNRTWNPRDWSNGALTKDGSTLEAIRAFDIQWVVITVVTFLLALLIVSFTVVHTRYILSNQTTIESLQDVRSMHVKVQYRKRESTPQPHNSVNVNAGGSGADGVAGLPPFMSEINHNIVMVEQGERLWDQGSWLANWKSIMGPTWWLWFVPYWNSQGDGIHDIYNANVYKRLLADALAQARMQAFNFGVVRDLAGEELTGPVSPGLGSASGSLSSSPHSPTSPTRPKNGTVGRQTNVPVWSSSGSGSTSPGGTGSTRKRMATAPPMLMPSIRMQYDGSEASGSRDPGLQLRQGVASSIDSQAGQADVSVDDGSMVAQGHRSSSAVSTPRQNNTPRSQSPRQPRTPKARSQESGNNTTSRRRQRTMSGGTSASYGFGGPIKEFGLGLGMDGIPVDSGTGLKLSSALLNRYLVQSNTCTGNFVHY